MKKILIGFTLMVAIMTINETASAQTSGNQSNWNTPILTNIIPASSTSGTSIGLIVLTPIVITPTTISPIPPIEVSSGIVLQSETSILFPEAPVVPTESGVYLPGESSGVTVSPGGAVTFSFTGFDAGGVIFFSGGENFAASLG